MSGKGKDFRPICDTWLLAPSKVHYWGAFPSGFLQRARCLLCRMDEALLHVCAGKVRDYPGYGFGPNDQTLDVNPALRPTYLQDARDPWPLYCGVYPWVAILVDPPYTELDASRYQQYVEVKREVRTGIMCEDHNPQMAAVFPRPAELLKRAWEVLAPGGKLGLLHQFHPKGPGTDARLVACVQVVQGTNQQPRCFTVWEKEFSP